MVEMRKAALVASLAVALTVTGTGTGAGAAGAGSGGLGSGALGSGGVGAGGAGGALRAGSDGGGGAGVGDAGVGDAGFALIAPEADVAHHGHAFLSGDRLGVLLVTQNHGPSSLETVTVRLSFSVPPAVGTALPSHCLWGGEREVLCSAGPLRADGPGRETTFQLRLAGAPVEVTVRVATAWNGGATDRNPENDDHQVVVPATADAYAF
ncbi:hypothetical protein [Streptomyces sp. NPDC006368]|uniref:hypothetical protein n=1 Tax=Streptomyces sp. NPDC006368 TaxID=3156760 RepID=UPI00339F2301